MAVDTPLKVKALTLAVRVCLVPGTYVRPALRAYLVAYDHDSSRFGADEFVEPAPLVQRAL